MKLFRPLFACALLAAVCPALAEEESGHATNSARPPGLLNRLLHPIHKDEAVGDTAKPVWHGLALVLTLDPQPLKLSAAHQLKVSLLLINKSKKAVQLDFPTTQRIEVVVKNAAGKMLEQWSEDHSFTPDPGIININPAERLEYSATLSTRDMAAFETYTVEAFFPKYEALRAQRTIVPGK